MSDCALAIKTAVSLCFCDLADGAPRHYWCYFHVMKAMKAKARMYLGQRSAKAISNFQKLMHAKTFPKSQAIIFLSKWREIDEPFAKYVDSQWYTHIKHWSIFYRVTAHQNMHTNNYTKAWHLILKTKFIPPPKCCRIDELIQILCDVVEPHFSHKFYQVDTGFRKQVANLYQQRSKTRADGYTREHLAVIGAEIHWYTSRFVVSSFSAPGLRFYHVHYKAAVGLSRARLISCSCKHFTQVGSGCLHMYYLAQEYRMLVVERAPSSVHTIDPTFINGDLDIELIQTTQSGMHKRRISGAFSPREATDSKRSRFAPPPIPTFIASHPNLTACPLEPPTATPSDLTCITNALPIHFNKEFSHPTSPHSKGAASKGLDSAITILKRAIEVMKKKKDRTTMANATPPATMNHYQGVCHALLHMVEERSPGLSQTLQPVFCGIADTSWLSNAEVRALTFQMQESGLAALKKTYALLRVGKHSKAFVANSTKLSVGLFKERCYEVVGLLEEARVLTARVQVR
ncbi:hypothetical protein PTTG_29348 [Puccinia triticina 1-1 BBBD Race 1]|uniref:SWIM-type domain-containing protein n=1 Tax=Puccinia triticina (isolate 1-1 / race 1 (BBBD)) TaxID=630390 RepID=A0A180G5D3_PUCT1|nr:hypothetical protein PTTG_29348 [Puccinia triticina 1-1 BBBD Race 1]